MPNRKAPRHLEPVFQKQIRFTEAIEQLEAAAEMVEEIAADMSIATYLNIRQFRSSMTGCVGAVNYAIPHAVCPACSGVPGKVSTCRVCCQVGWVNKTMAKQHEKFGGG